MWNNHHSQRAISGISNLKRFPICISADAINKRKTRQIFILIKDDEKDLFFPQSERTNQWEGGQISYPKCIVDIETITELIVLPAAITPKID